MIQNTVVFIVNGDGSFFKQPPNTKFTANSVNKNSIFVIAPFVNTASIIANFKVAHKLKQDSRVATLTDMQPREITNESYVFDWNVWEVKVPQPTLQFLSNNRGSEILVSFTVGETQVSRVIPKYKTILAKITDTSFVLPSITVDGRYIVKVASYEYANGLYAFFNDTIIADNDNQRYIVYRAKYSGGTTPTVAFKVDPNIPMENFDEYEPTVVEQLILQVNENSGDIVTLENEVVNLQYRTTQSESDINLIEADVLELQGKVESHIEDLDNPHAVTAEQVNTYNKTTIDIKDANTLQEAKDYTYSKVVIDNKDTVIMNKANNLENANMFKDVNYNNVNGVLTFTKYDDTTKLIDLPLELIVTSGYYDEVTNELVLVLANGSEIKIPVDNLLTDLDAHNIRFNGSGTNYLVNKNDVESAVKELDTRVKTNADNVALKVNTSDIVDNLNSTDTNKPLSANQGKVLNDTTAKLTVSNVFTQPQQVPNATLPQHTTNLSQVETMFEMFKRELRGYNLASPDLTGKQYLGNGVYRLSDTYFDITLDYNVYNGQFILNGTSGDDEPYGVRNFIINIPVNETYTINYNIINNGVNSVDQFLLRFGLIGNANNQINLKNNAQNTFIMEYSNLNIRIANGDFTNHIFTLQIEKGTEATPYTVPGQIPTYKIVGEE